tara:strand:+ start:166 stop:372 length:207 start_codon:yes stop_codon:yes gene_type:complete
LPKEKFWGISERLSKSKLATNIPSFAEKQFSNDILINSVPLEQINNVHEDTKDWISLVYEILKIKPKE